MLSRVRLSLQWVHGRITVVMQNEIPVSERQQRLQWVHGRINVVMTNYRRRRNQDPRLQWVHGRITVVMFMEMHGLKRVETASMGPRSDNRGYAYRAANPGSTIAELQWVHGRITVVM